MFLHKIKLAGFKSFVDPTTIVLPSNVVGVVGPNGCGKSNVADAVRWVMGEVSAKHLRGGSMADVVFNGSTARKPVGLASVEILLDNADGRLGGQYSGYGEIAIRRQVGRDGQSAYFLNGRRCRRRDVTDIFLGTGLGPRSYAIIEQGMVSRLIEAKPEELREFLEEAAGVSKYKERRRETENRIGHTRENLDRLQDIREELGKRLQHLKRQAAAAEKYIRLKEEERLARAQLLAVHWRALAQGLAVRDREIQDQEAAMAADVAAQQALESLLDTQRGEHATARDEFNDGYRAVLDVGAEIARREETIQSLGAQGQRVRRTLGKEEEALKEAGEHLAAEKKEIETLEAKLADADPALAEANAEVARAGADYAKAEAAMEEWSTTWEAIGLRVAEAAQTVQAGEGRMEQLKGRVADADRHYARLQEEQEKLGTQALEQEIADLTGKLQAREEDRARLQARLAQHRTALRGLERRIQELSSKLDTARGRFQEARGKLASLTTLQQDALGKGEGAVMDWLRGHDLAESARLAEGLTVAEGWERAVETVLGDALRAVCVPGLDEPARLLADLREGSLTLFDTLPDLIIPDIVGEGETEITGEASGANANAGREGHAGGVEDTADTSHTKSLARTKSLAHPKPLLPTPPVPGKGEKQKITSRIARGVSRIFRQMTRRGRAELVLEEAAAMLEGQHQEGEAPDTILGEFETEHEAVPALEVLDTLAEQVTAPWPLDNLFAGVRPTDGLDQALALRSTLVPGQSVITPAGEWLGRDWLRVHRDTDPAAGVLPREREIRTMTALIEDLQSRIDAWEASLETARQERAALEKARSGTQAAIGEAERKHAGLQSRLIEQQARLEELRRRSQVVVAELAELTERRRQTALELARMTTVLEEQRAAWESLVRERDAESGRRKEYQERFTASRNHWQQTRDKAHRMDLDLASARTQYQSLLQARTRDSEQLARLGARCEELRQSLAEMERPLQKAQAEVTEYRARRETLEAALQETRRRVDGLDAAVRESDRKRHALSQRVESDRARLEKIRLARQETHARQGAIGEQVAASGHEIQTLLTALPEEANEADWRVKIEGLGDRIARLGAINLAAVQEHAQQLEEKERLDAQHQDLMDALATLEEAMRDMDRETRTRFIQTHEKVNGHLGQLFPRLFGGGQASLELTGTDPLDAGVTVMARPPGKRNSTISQLSGGEKALTAVALVFALFELNPAPFCLLDEVDAPLDDANVYRFRDLVKEMSRRVQFVLITHNKNTMEIAHQLVGVTMSEPGVSRLVSVDIDQLVEERKDQGGVIEGRMVEVGT
uniref:Chromosome partition protein Smc n=1 Tax=Candidatus Kentrum sp. FM TaxID=2126340 RepID=A0A450T5S4_9GAMM|nr:MAG: chromosome segregation protein [Candidatus Kentron sp. FM]VFJ62114.1 MAG: chromosome segregation protein [Candidatus Kentron sp. FM]VFK14051.1 MAG: chromosome segregation protein [Candidatus Kentron sp. FM]